MPRDQDYGEELASLLTEEYLGLVGTVEFTYDAYLDLERMEPGVPYCVVSTNNYTQEREGRDIWREAIVLGLTLVSAVGPTDKIQWVGDWLSSWDMVVRQTREMKLFGKHKPSGLELDERFDTNLFHNHRRLVTYASLHYLNVEVK